MNLKLTVLFLFAFVRISNAQISMAKGGLFYAKEYSKEISLYSTPHFRDQKVSRLS